MDIGLTGKRAAVAAATQGLGFGVAQALANEGVTVAICGRSQEKVDAAVAQLGPDAIGIVADVNTPDGAVAFVHSAMAQVGGLDILVTNTGGPPPGRAAEMDVHAYETAFASLCSSAIAMCDAVLPEMRGQGWGRIVAITSTSVREPIATLALSNVARSAYTSYLKSLSGDVASAGITVNSVQPGLHATQRIADLHSGNVDDVARSTPTGHLGDPIDFGAVVAFLCSEQAKYINGAAVPVDGGAYKGLQ
jgi:3-oxoacyl-[acyl-carrier protein] reductase